MKPNSANVWLYYNGLAMVLSIIPWQGLVQYLERFSFLPRQVVRMLIVVLLSFTLCWTTFQCLLLYDVYADEVVCMQIFRVKRIIEDHKVHSERVKPNFCCKGLASLINQSIFCSTNIPGKPDSVLWQPHRCSTVNSMKQFHNINGPSGVRGSMVGNA